MIGYLVVGYAIMGWCVVMTVCTMLVILGGIGESLNDA